jgi:hypothetical protein
LKLEIEKIAKICHEANKVYCELHGDFSQRSWEDSPDFIKHSAIDGVEYHMNNPEAKASSSHENWLRFKEAEGWVYGEVKDVLKKTHPCMVPFDELPEFQQTKDILFRNIVESFK